jgi:hypothetical protein
VLAAVTEKMDRQCPACTMSAIATVVSRRNADIIACACESTRHHHIMPDKRHA